MALQFQRHAMHQRCGKTRNEGHDQYEDAENVFTQTQTLIPTLDLPYAFSLPPSFSSSYYSSSSSSSMVEVGAPDECPLELPTFAVSLPS